MKVECSDGVGRNYVIRIFTVRGLYEVKDFAILSLKNQTGTLLSKAWIGLLMFIGVPFCIKLYYGGKVATDGVNQRLADIWWFLLYRSNSR